MQSARWWRQVAVLAVSVLVMGHAMTVPDAAHSISEEGHGEVSQKPSESEAHASEQPQQGSQPRAPQLSTKHPKGGFWSLSHQSSPEAAPVVFAQVDSSEDALTLRKAWYINLDSHTQRRQLQEERSSAIPCKLERHPAVSVKTLKEALDNPFYRPLIENTPSFSYHVTEGGADVAHPTNPLSEKAQFVISVCLSHFSAYEKALKEFPDGRGYVMILEDDARVSDNIASDLPKLVANAPSDWEIIRVGTWGNQRESDKDPDHSIFYRATPPFAEGSNYHYGGAHMVLLRLSTLPSVLDKLTRMEMTDVDDMITHFPEIKSYAIPRVLDVSKNLVSIVGVERSHPGGATDDVSSAAELKEGTHALAALTQANKVVKQ